MLGLIVGTIFLVLWVFLRPAAVVLAAVVVLATIGSIYSRARLRRFAANRTDESIGSFAKSFPRQSVDPWILRAVYEGFARYFAAEQRGFSVRPSDRLDEDLRLDAGDLEELIEEISARAGRSLRDHAANPWSGRVQTIADLVAYLQAQPRTGDPEA
jgi:hypothetical protein